MKARFLLVSAVLQFLYPHSTTAKIRPVMSKELYERLVKKGATRLNDEMKKYACQYYPQLQSCQMARRNRRTLDYLAYLYLHNGYRSVAIREGKDTRKTVARSFPSRSYRSNRRKRRSIPGNPCRINTAIPMVHFYAIDVLEKQIVELLQNPAGGDYQKFFTYPCKSMIFHGLKCEPEHIEYLAAVFVDTDQVRMRRIRVPTTCAITIGT